MENQKQTSSSRKCRRVWSWMVMLLLWASIFFMIATSFTRDNDAFPVAIGLLVFFYITYAITSCCSPTCSYLFNKHKAESIHDYMKNMFYTAPNIKWNIECYHYETRRYHHKKSDGSVETRHESVKVVTHTAQQNFHFYSWRDISGLFLLDSHKIFLSQKKVYIKLELEQNIDLADDITRYDYQRQKDDFYHRHQWRDVHVHLTENRHVSGFNQFNMVRISNAHPACVNKWVYFLFVFIFPLVEFYKMYVNQFCVEQDYKLTKIISTRFDLNQPQHFEPYQHLIPALAIFDQPKQVYNEQTILIHNTPEIPSMDELDDAKKFSNGVSPGSNTAQIYQPHFRLPEQQVDIIQQNTFQNNQNAQFPSLPNNINYYQQNIGINGNSEVNLNINLNEKLI